MTLTITVPIPPACLSPNARAHWATRSRATKMTRATTAIVARDAVRRAGWRGPLAEGITAQVMMYVADRRRRDADNYLSRCKAIFDGLTDGGVWVDDCRVTHLPLVFAVDAANPRVVITVSGEAQRDLFTAVRARRERVAPKGESE